MASVYTHDAVHCTCDWNAYPSIGQKALHLLYVHLVTWGLGKLASRMKTVENLVASDQKSY